MESLKKWSNLIREHVKKLNIDESLRTKLIDKLKLNYQNYQEPDDQHNIQNNINKNSTTITSTSSSKSSNISGGLSQIFSKKDTISNKILLSTATTDALKTDELIPLDPSILTSNLGVETIVIVTKVW